MQAQFPKIRMMIVIMMTVKRTVSGGQADVRADILLYMLKHDFRTRRYLMKVTRGF